VLQIALARRDEALGGGVGLLLVVFELLAHPLELRLQRHGLAGWARQGTQAARRKQPEASPTALTAPRSRTRRRSSPRGSSLTSIHKYGGSTRLLEENTAARKRKKENTTQGRMGGGTQPPHRDFKERCVMR